MHGPRAVSAAPGLLIITEGIPTTAQDVITDTLVALGEVGFNETVNSDDLSFGLTRLNGLLDSWSTERLSLYTVKRGQFTLSASTQDYTIGPTGTFTTVGRPVLIQTAAIIISATTIRFQMNVLTSKQWALIQEKGLTGVLPTDIYMDQEFPNAGIHLWPIPSGTPDIEIYFWAPLPVFVNVTDTFSLPPGYQDAVKYGLMVHLAQAYNKSIDPAILALAQQKKAAIQTLNAQILAGSFGESRTLHGPNIGAPVPPVLTPPGQGGEPGPTNF